MGSHEDLSIGVSSPHQELEMLRAENEHLRRTQASGTIAAIASSITTNLDVWAAKGLAVDAETGIPELDVDTAYKKAVRDAVVENIGKILAASSTETQLAVFNSVLPVKDRRKVIDAVATVKNETAEVRPIDKTKNTPTKTITNTLRAELRQQGCFGIQNIPKDTEVTFELVSRRSKTLFSTVDSEVVYTNNGGVVLSLTNEKMSGNLMFPRRSLVLKLPKFTLYTLGFVKENGALVNGVKPGKPIVITPVDGGSPLYYSKTVVGKFSVGDYTIDLIS